MKCLLCGEEFKKSQDRSKFCTSGCYRKYRYQHLKERADLKNCKTCNREFKSTSLNDYCSLKCLPTRICEYCGKEYEVTGWRQKYCSAICFDKVYEEYYIAYRKHYKRRKVKRIVFLDKICEICGKKFTPLSCRHKYCLLSCCQKAAYRKMRIKLGKELRKPKEEIKKKKCDVCGFNNILALHYHHLKSDDRKNNILVLCANCHSILHGRIGFNKRSNLTYQEVIDMIKCYP